MDRPILFRGEMVRALLDGRKTQTRRPAYKNGKPTIWLKMLRAWADRRELLPDDIKPNDRLYVRETWGGHWDPGGEIGRKPDRILYRADGHEGLVGWGPSIHMPRDVSRLTLIVAEVRKQALQDISEDDARAEGVEKMVMDEDQKFYLSDQGSYRCGFAGLYCHIHGKGVWDANPEIIALTFAVHQTNIDQLEPPIPLDNLPRGQLLPMSPDLVCPAP